MLDTVTFPWKTKPEGQDSSQKGRVRVSLRLLGFILWGLNLVAAYPIAVELFKNQDVNLMAFSIDRFAKVSGIRPLGLMNDGATFQGNPSSIC